MAGRRLPPEIMAYLGPCSEPEGDAEEIVEQIGLAKIMGDSCLTDFDPLVTLMCLVGNEMEEMKISIDRKKGRQTWLEAVAMIQDGSSSFEHNRYIPCRTCDQAFKPVIDEKLFVLFRTWYRSRRTADLIAIHKCQACGGTLRAEKTKTYHGDMHTPEPGSAKGDEHWAETLLERCDA